MDSIRVYIRNFEGNMRNLSKYILIAALILTGLYYTYAQDIPSRFSGKFSEYLVEDNYDTLVLHRHPGDWWFGISGGANLTANYSDFLIPRYPSEAIDDNNRLIPFSSDFGDGMFLGLTGQWLPMGSKWGGMVDLMVYDSRYSASESDKFEYAPIDSSSQQFEQKNKYYEAQTYHNYLTLSPSIRYNLPIFGMYVYAGLDLEILTASEIRQRLKFENSGAIDQDELVEYESVSTRIGFHLGTGYDFFVADFNHRWRLYFSPFITINGGSTYFDAYGSSRKNFITRVGLSLKFSPDEITTEKLLFDPTYEPPLEQIARIKIERPVEFIGFESETEVGQDIAYFPFRETDEKKDNETSVETGELSNRIDSTEIEIAEVDTSSTDITEVDTSSTDITEIDTSSTDITEVDTSSTDITEIDTSSTDITEVDTSSTDITEVDTSSTDITEPDKDTATVIAEIPREEDDIVINPNERKTIRFRTSPGSKDRKWLDKLAEYLKANPGARLRIVGHADNTGNELSQESRAQRRADAIVNYLRGKGIDRRRLLDQNQGARSPVAPNDTERNRNRNKRVVIQIIR